jgi:hypothetical protein
MRISLLFIVSVYSGAAFAQAVDCEALKNTSVPYQVSWTYKSSKFVDQVYRDKSGDFVVWRQMSNSAGVLQVSKTAVFDGAGTEALVTTTQTGKNKLQKIKSITAGVPKGFDRRSDITMKATYSVSFADGSTEEFSTSTAYRFGPCILRIVRGENTPTRDGKTFGPATAFYLPDLKGSVLAPADADSEFELSTRFTPLELLK